MELIAEAAKQVPALAVLALIVRIFITAQGDHAKQMRDLMRWSHDQIKSLSDDCHAVSRDSTAATREHSSALNDLKITLISLKATLRRVNGVSKHG